MRLEAPWLLILLLPLAALFLPRRDRDPLRLALPPDDPSWPPGLRARLLWLPRLLCAIAAVLTAVSAAGPCRRVARVEDRRMARDIVLVLDASESMKGVDMQLDGAPASRMAAALRCAGEFVEGRAGDRVGVVAFGNRAVTQCPLTFDREIARTLLGHVRPDALGKRTALGEAVALGAARLPRGGALVLLTDGRNTAGEVSPRDAALAAAATSVRIYALSVGSDGPVPIPARMPSGRMRMEQKPYALDEAALRSLAELTGGRYFRAADADALRDALSAVDELEKHDTPTPRAVPVGRLARWATALAAAALACSLALSATVLRTLPRLR
jgi:Ca-activated chloride channel family protein